MSASSNANARNDDVVLPIPPQTLPSQRDASIDAYIPDNVFPLRETDRAYIPGQVAASALPSSRKVRARDGWAAEWPMLSVVATIGLSLAVVFAGLFHLGIALFVAAIALAFVLRLVLPDEQAGMLKVRSRGIDAAIFAGIGILTVFVAFTLPPL